MLHAAVGWLVQLWPLYLPAARHEVALKACCGWGGGGDSCRLIHVRMQVEAVRSLHVTRPWAGTMGYALPVSTYTVPAADG